MAAPSVAWDDPRVLASPVPAITRDYLMAVARLRLGLPAPGPRRRQSSRSSVGLTDEQRRLFCDEAVVPLGWRWCPDCNGEGVIATMDASPDLNERVEVCHRCEAERGIVAEERL